MSYKFEYESWFLCNDKLKEMKKQFDERDMAATLVDDTDRYTAIDLRRRDGSSDYYCNFIIDKKNGTLVISGDLGHCIACWHNTNSVANIAHYVRDIGYFIGKFAASSDKYFYETDAILNDIKEHAKDYEWEFDNIEEAEEFWDSVENDLDGMYDTYISDDQFIPGTHLCDEISKYDGNYYEWLYSCGRRYSPRVYLWIIGLNMACEQLGIL